MTQPTSPKTTPKPTAKPKSAEQFLRELAASNTTIAEWARLHKQPVMTVYGLLYGRIHGRRGGARSVAIAMGLQLADAQQSAGRGRTPGRAAA